MAANDVGVFYTDQLENKICMVTFHSTDIQGPAEIPDDLQTQLWVEPLARGICPW
jgi:hypothetical protein